MDVNYSFNRSVLFYGWAVLEDLFVWTIISSQKTINDAPTQTVGGVLCNRHVWTEWGKSWDAGERGHRPLLYQKGGNGG